MEKLELKVQLLVDDTGEAGDIRRELSAKEVELASKKSALETNEATPKAKDRECDQLSSNL